MGNKSDDLIAYQCTFLGYHWTREEILVICFRLRGQALQTDTFYSKRNKLFRLGHGPPGSATVNDQPGEPVSPVFNRITCS